MSKHKHRAPRPAPLLQQGTSPAVSPIFEEARQALLTKIAAAGAAPAPLGHFVRHTYVNGELSS